MALNLSNSFARLSPRTKQIAVITAAILALGSALYISVGSTDSGPETRWNKATDKQVSVITDQNNKNMGLEAMAGRIKYLDRSNSILQKQIERLERERAAEKTTATQERLWMYRTRQAQSPTTGYVEAHPAKGKKLRRVWGHHY